MVIPSIQLAPLLAFTFLYASLILSLLRISSNSCDIDLSPFFVMLRTLLVLPPMEASLRYVFATIFLVGHECLLLRVHLTLELFSPSLHFHYRSFLTTMASADLVEVLVPFRVLLTVRCYYG